MRDGHWRKLAIDREGTPEKSLANYSKHRSKQMGRMYREQCCGSGSALNLTLLDPDVVQDSGARKYANVNRETWCLLTFYLHRGSGIREFYPGSDFSPPQIPDPDFLPIPFPEPQYCIAIKYNFHAKILLFVTARFDHDPDTHGSVLVWLPVSGTVLVPYALR